MKWIALCVGAVLASVMWVTVTRLALNASHFQDLEPMSALQIRSAPYRQRSAMRYGFGGMLPRPAGVQDRIRLTFESEGRFEVQILFRDGEGDMVFPGLVDEMTGRFMCGPHLAAVEFPYLNAVRGMLHGPALVSGRPAVYVEVEGLRWVAERNDYAPVAGFRWQGMLPSEGGPYGGR